MLNNKKSPVFGVAVLLAGFAAAHAAQAGYDAPAAQAAAPLQSGLHLRPGYDVLERGVDLTVTASVAPSLEITAPLRRSAPNYNVFKSVVVPVGKLAAFAQWSKVRPDWGAVADFCAGSFCDSTVGRKLAAAAEQARGLSQLEALALVNRTVNRTIAYRSDKGDQWQTLEQSAARGTGDCEDFAIAKMALLAAIGFAPEQLQFIVLKDTRRQLYHAVLAVHVEGKRYILDNLSNTAASDDIFRTYKPIVSFVGTKSYVHGFKGRETAVAVGAGGFEAIRLGN
ncbi:MAG TPA: transglutaminase-like cysteine peptidase [Devosia sp.]